MWKTLSSQSIAYWCHQSTVLFLIYRAMNVRLWKLFTITQHIRALLRFLYRSHPLQNFRCLYFVKCSQFIFSRSTVTVHLHKGTYVCIVCLFVTEIEYYCLTAYYHDNEFIVSYDLGHISIPCDARLPTWIHNVGYIGWWVLFLCLLSVILAGLYTSDIVRLCKLAA